MIKKILSKKAVSALLIAISSLALGQTENSNVASKAPEVLFGWDFSTLPGGSGNYGPSTYDTTMSNENLEVSGLVRGLGLGTSSGGSRGGYGAFGFGAQTKAEAIANGHYFTFTVKSKLNYEFSLSSISIFDYQRRGSTPTFGMIQYSIDNGNSYIDIKQVNYSSASVSGASIAPISLMQVSALQNIQATTKVVFRIVNWGGSVQAGKWFFFDKASSTALDFAVTGTVKSVITPGVLFGWDFSPLPGGANNYGPSPYNVTYADPNVEVSGLLRGSGLTTATGGSKGGLGAYGWGAQSKQEAIDKKHFFTFKIKTKKGSKMSLFNVSIFDYQRRGSTPTLGMLQYSIDGGLTFYDIKQVNYSSASVAGASLLPISLSNFQDLQNIGGGKEIVFRLVNWGGSVQAGKWFFFDKNKTTGLDFAFFGSTEVTDVIWNGTAWSNVVGPNSKINAHIEGPYHENIDFVAKNLYVTTGSLDIQPGHSVTIHEGVFQDNDNKITVQSDANFVQLSETNINDSKSIIVKRGAYVPKAEFVFWSSPVVSQNLFTLFPGLPSTGVLFYNTATDKYSRLSVGSTSIFGKGYAIKGSTTMPTQIESTFIGVPNNGGGIFNVSNLGNRFNLVGNPYPSNIDLIKWYQDNVSNLDSSIDGATAYLWDNTNNSIYTQMGNGYSGINYAVYNFESQIGVSAPQVGAVKTPTNILKVGQGFMVKVAANANSVVYNNLQRSANQNSVFFKGGNQKDRFWLLLTTPKGLLLNTAIAYFTDKASKNYDKYDSSVINEEASELLYTKSDDGVKLTIQGRNNFIDSDRVNVGIRTFNTGIYKISISELEGIFGNQSIYLFDKILNKVVDLKKEDYTFTADKGLIDDRFEILYKEQQVIIPIRAQQNLKFDVYYENTSYSIKSDKDILKVELFDMNGILKQAVNVNSNSISIDRSNLNKGVFIIKIYHKNGEVSSSLVKN